MNQNSNSNFENYESQNENFQQIDLVLILNTFLRNKRLISAFFLIFFVFGIFNALKLKKVWGGEFQIVLDRKEDTIPNQTIKVLEDLNLLPQTSKQNSLKTEVEILKSPSVLIPVFEFARSQTGKSLTYSSWKDNLEIDLEKGTSILNISYKNVNKDTIIPVLKKMSITYQEYSGKNKRRSNELKKNFLKQKIEIYKQKSSDSLRSAQEYAIENDLVFNEWEGFNRKNLTIVPDLDLLSENSEVEKSRIEAANQIRSINFQLQKIKELENAEEVQYISSLIPALVKEGLPTILNEIDDELVQMRTKYTEEDISIKRLIEKRNLAINYLKERAIKSLELQKINAEARMEAASRPKDIVIKYKELIREASRNENTLINLEENLNVFNIRSAAKEDPWELITKPTLLDIPLPSGKLRILIIYSMLGFVLGALISVIKEKTTGKIYDIAEIQRLIPIRILSEINLDRLHFQNQKITLIRDVFNEDQNEYINFVKLGYLEANDLEEFKSALINQGYEKEIIFSNNYDELEKCSNYLIMKLAYLNYSDVFIFNKRLNFLKNNFKGLIIFD